LLLCVLGAALPASAATTDTYPARVVRILTAEVGGGADFVARVIAQGLTEALRQQVIIENRTSVLSIEIASRATPDGHTLLLYGSALWLMPYIRSKVPWDPIRDFAPVTVPASSPNIVAVHQGLPVRSVQELVSLAKAKPGELTYGSSFAGATHIATELFKSMANVDIRHIPYKGNGLALNALVAGEVQVMFPNAASATPHIRSGRIRGLAVTSPQPSPLAPGIPTVAASGLPGYESVSFHALMAPARTPPAIVARLHDIVALYVQGEAVGKRLLAAGVEPVGNSPEDLARTIRSEMQRVGKVISAAGIRAD
jgi:tripartite-type tricarboxylate transporter receptor subunit TctC